MNFKQTLIAGAIILSCAIAYEYVNTYRTVAVWPSDAAEYTIKCYPFRIELYKWDEKLYSTTDTQKIVNEIMGYYDPLLPVILFSGPCTTFENDSTAARIKIQKLIGGARCNDNTLTVNFN
jgi:hypothetical protein